MGKISDYTVGAVKSGDLITVSDADTLETKNITVSDIAGSVVDGSVWTTVTVPVSSAQLLTIYNTPVDILPALDADQYYEYRAILKYYYNTTAYTVSGGGSLVLTQGGGADYYFDRLAITKTFDTFSFGTFYGHGIPGAAVRLTSPSNPTLGNGTVDIVISYTIKTF